jgi:hypothetical protein
MSDDGPRVEPDGETGEAAVDTADTADDGDGTTGPDGSAGPRGRDVEVPLRVYKTVTVFSTLFAVGAVVLGFVLLDGATQRATAAPEDVNVLVALLGLGSIAAGAAVYAFSTRFRARGMGKPKDDAD